MSTWKVAQTMSVVFQVLMGPGTPPERSCLDYWLDLDMRRLK